LRGFYFKIRWCLNAIDPYSFKNNQQKIFTYLFWTIIKQQYILMHNYERSIFFYFHFVFHIILEMSLERLRTGFDRDVYYFLYDEDVDAITARLTIQKLENWILGKCQIDLTQNKRVFKGFLMEFRLFRYYTYTYCF